jgi:hypothetical protein
MIVQKAITIDSTTKAAVIAGYEANSKYQLAKQVALKIDQVMFFDGR